VDVKWDAVLRSVPHAPGVYQFKDARGKPLYIGKAVDLHDRVRQYITQTDSRVAMVRELMRRAADLSFIVTESEYDALVLEANLVKQFRPRYNVMLKDDKSFPYVKLTAEEFPRVLLTRQWVPDGGAYWGPFTNVRALRATLKFVAGLFAVRTCSLEIDGRKKYPKPCLDYHLKLCTAPCVNYVSPEDYQVQCEALAKFYSGSYAEVQRTLAGRMQQASEQRRYEQAARYRDLLRSLERVVQKSRVVARKGDDLDALGFAASGDELMVVALQVRDGRLIGDREFVLANELELTREELLANFLQLYYFHPPNIPREILLPFVPAGLEILRRFVSAKKGSAVALTVPQRGRKRDLAELAATNAAERLRAHLVRAPQVREPGAAARILAEVLHLEQPPRRIEGYDISNIHGRQASGSLVLFQDGRPQPEGYRLFNIRLQQTPDDFAMMREVLRRRFLRMMTDDAWAQPPDLILLDGGKGQLSSVLAVRDELAGDPSFSSEQRELLSRFGVAALAKREELLYFVDEHGRFREVKLRATDPGLSLLVSVRDEAHRFCLKQHRARREKAAVRSVLDDIPGVGPVRRKQLLRRFGTLAGMRQAGADGIAQVPGIGLALAQRIYAALLEEAFVEIAVDEARIRRHLRLRPVPHPVEEQ